MAWALASGITPSCWPWLTHRALPLQRLGRPFQRFHLGQQAAVHHHRGLHQIGPGAQQAQRHDAALAEAAEHGAGRAARPARARACTVCATSVSAGGFLKAVDAARAIGFAC
jgi:hypothetical protein